PLDPKHTSTLPSSNPDAIHELPPSGQEVIHELPVGPASPPLGPVTPGQVGYHFRGYDPVQMFGQPSESGTEEHESIDERLSAQLEPVQPERPQPALHQGEQTSQPQLVSLEEALIQAGPSGIIPEHPRPVPLTNAADFILPEPKTDEQLALEEDYISKVYKRPITRRPAAQAGYW